MKIGVISDTHDRTPNIARAVEIFNENELAAVLHCGDFVAPFSLIPFKKLKHPFYAVFGNNDGERAGLSSIFSGNGWRLNERPWTFNLNGTNITMMHEPSNIEDHALRGGVDLIVFGHTHEKHFRIRNGVMILNPGEGCGWVKGTASISIVDTAKRENWYIDL